MVYPYSFHNGNPINEIVLFIVMSLNVVWSLYFLSHNCSWELSFSDNFLEFEFKFDDVFYVVFTLSYYRLPERNYRKY